jgi:hypothetical protein
MKVLLTKTKPELFFAFLETVASLQPCTIEQIRKHMKSKWGPVRSARNFASQYGFVSMQEKTKKFSLTTDGERLLRYTNNSRIDFLIFNFKLQDYEPFLSLQYELSLKTKMKISEIGDFLDTKFPHKEKWDSKEKFEYGETFAEWLILLRIVKREGDTLTYSKGVVKTFQIIVIPEMKQLLDRTLYDFLTEKFHTPHNILDEPYDLLNETKKATDDEKKGELFELFIGSVFTRFGFSSRLKDGIRERCSNLTFKRKGGGDVALFCHFPIPTDKQTYHGYAIACEGKATENAIGSKAVGQARNLCKKIQELYPQYFVHTIIMSQSPYGYDSSGREQAPPEVLHLNTKTMLNLLDLQKKRLEKGLLLITPVHVMLLLEELIKNQDFNPKPEKVVEIVEKLLESY